MPKILKKRNWAFVCYPESLPDNWLDLLQKTGLKIAISPLHDKDLNPDEEEKKPHYHVICCWEGPAALSVVKRITELVNGTIPIPLDSIRGYYRYFTHKDNPEKYQYDERDIKLVNGFSIRDFVELTRSETQQIKKDLRELIRQNGICEYCDLMDYLDANGTDEQIEVASCNTLHFSALLSSIRYKNRQGD